MPARYLKICKYVPGLTKSHTEGAKFPRQIYAISNSMAKAIWLNKFRTRSQAPFLTSSHLPRSNIYRWPVAMFYYYFPGTTLETENVSGRIIMFVLFTFVIFLYTAYSACIVALLQSSTDSIKTLKNLLDSGLTLGVEDVVYNRHYFPVLILWLSFRQ
jgi:hypothetical protein